MYEVRRENALLPTALLVVFCACASAPDEAEFERWYLGEHPYGEEAHADHALEEDEEAMDESDMPAMLPANEAEEAAAFDAEDESDEETLTSALVDEGADDEDGDDLIYFDDEGEDFEIEEEVDFFAASNPPMLTSTMEAATTAGFAKGRVDRFRFSGWVRGWACDRRTPKKSVDVLLTLRNSKGKRLERIRVKANKESGSWVKKKCNGGTAHRFSGYFKRKKIPCGAKVGLIVVGSKDEKHYFTQHRKIRCNPIGETFKIGRKGKITGWACDQNKPGKRNYVSVVRSKGKNRKKRTNVKHGGWVASRCSGGAAKHRFKFDVGTLKCGEKVRVYSHNLGARGKKRTLIGKRNMPSCNPGTKNHRNPVSGYISSHFGYRWHPILGRYRLHAGTDFAAPSGRSVYATQSGRVDFRGWTSGGGRVVQINHGKGVKTRYLHLSKFHVKHGQTVKKGQRIGRVGSTGLATGPHLHFEYWKDGRPRNPLKILP